MSSKVAEVMVRSAKAIQEDAGTRTSQDRKLASAQESTSFLQALGRWWNSGEHLVNSCGYACAKTWDGDPNSSAAPTSETRTNGDQVWATVNVVLVVLPYGQAGLEAVAASRLLIAARGAAAAESSFFQGARYSEKVLEQMRRGPGEFHSFPESVKAFEGAGTVRTITGGDGVARQMLEIPGSYATPGNVLNGGGVWRDGVFQFIKEADGTINHRLFVPGP